MTTNYERAFAGRPEVYAAWGQLIGAIKSGMDVRRYELVTLAAARRLRSSYCCLAHGSILQELGESVPAIALDHRSSAYVNIASGSTKVAMEILADDLVIAARGEASIARASMTSVPFPCAAVVVHITEIRDHSVRGIRFFAPTYEFGEDKQHRGDVERAVFSELTTVLDETKALENRSAPPSGADHA